MNMAEKKVGVLIKEARTAAGLTQEKLARAAGEGLTALDISKCERGEADLTIAQLKKIAVVCKVTQKSLVDAPKNLKTTAAKPSASKTDEKKTAAKATSSKTATAKSDEKKTAAKATSAKTTSAKTSSAKTSSAKTTTAAKKTESKTTTPASANTSMKVTTTEKKLIEAYREAPSDLKKAALKVLKGEYGDTINTLLGASSASGATAADGIGEMIGGLLGNLLGGK